MSSLSESNILKKVQARELFGEYASAWKDVGICRLWYTSSSMLSISSSLASEPGPSNVILPSSPSLKEILGLKRLDPNTDKLISVVAPGVLVKYGLDYDAEVRALQFVHGRLSVRTPRILQHAPFTEPWNWKEGVWYFLNAQVCLLLRLLVACPPQNSKISLVSCSSFSTRCAHTWARHSETLTAVPTTTGTCLSLGTLHTLIFKHQGLPRLLPRHIPRILWTRVRGGAIRLFSDRGTVLPHSRRPPPSQHSRGRVEDYSHSWLGDCWLLYRVLWVLPDAWAGMDDACMGRCPCPHFPRSASEGWDNGCYLGSLMIIRK